MRTTPAAALASIGLLAATLPLAAAGAAASQVPTCDGRAATIVAEAVPGGPVPLTLGTAGDDVIVGTSFDDRIDGGEGNDTVCALGGADLVVGGPGDDRLFGGLDARGPGRDHRGDVVQPGPGDDLVDLGPDGSWEGLTSTDGAHGDQVSYTDAPGPVHVDLGAGVATGHGTDTIVVGEVGRFSGIAGSAHDDVLIGGPADDRIGGGGGDDLVRGGPGQDLLAGDPVPGPNQRITWATGRDVVEGGPGHDSLHGGEGDVLRGGAEEDWLVAGPGAAAYGGRGDDRFDGSLAAPRRIGAPRTLVGGAGRDRLQLGLAFRGASPRWDLLVDVPRGVVRHHGRRWGGIRSTELFELGSGSSTGRVRFRGGRADEVLWVDRRIGGFRVVARGGAGNDSLTGADRRDLLDGGRGRDDLDGRAGRDRCVAGEYLRSCERRG